MFAVRKDRLDLPQYEDSRGRGVFVLMKDDIIGVHQVLIETDCEIVCVKFDIVGTKSAYVAAYYLPNEKETVNVEELTQNQQPHLDMWGLQLPMIQLEKKLHKDGCASQNSPGGSLTSWLTMA